MSAPLRVGLVCYRVDGRAGMERQAGLLAAGLARRGLAVRYVSTCTPREWPALARRPVPRAPGVPVVRVPVTRTPLFEAAALAWLLRRGGVDALAGIGYRCGAHAVRLGRVLRAPVAVKYACAGEHGDFALLARGDPAERALVRTAARHVWINEAIRDEALAAGVPGDRLVGIPNGVDLAAWSATATAAPAPLPCPAEAPVVLFVGRLTAQKRVDVLLEAFARVAAGRPTARLALAGAGPLEATLRAQARAAGLEERTMFLGEREDVLALHRRAAAFVLPSDGEGVPNALLEAMAAGVPAVATDVPGSREVVRDGVDGLLVPAGDAGALAGALGRLLDDAGLAARLGAAGRARVAAGWDMERVADAWAGLLRGMVEGR